MSMFKLRKSGIVAGMVVLALGSLVACSSSSGSEPGEDSAQEGPIKMSLQMNVTYWETPVRHAVDEGWFEEAGIEITPVEYGVEAPLPLVLNNETEVGVFGLGSVITAASQGADIRAIAGMLVEGEPMEERLAGVVASAQSGITDLKGLEGKKVAVQELKGPSQAKVINHMKAEGADPSTVQWIATPFPGMVEAMERGDVDAAVAVQPFIGAMLGADGTYLSRVSDPGSPVPTYFAKSDFLEKNPELAKRFLSVLNRAWDYGNENRDEMKARFLEEAGLPAEAAAGLPDMNWQVALDEGAVLDNMQSMVDAGFLSQPLEFEQFVDPRFAKQ